MFKWLAGLCGDNDDDEPKAKPNPPPSLGPSRAGLFFGYFGSDDAQPAETAGTVNLTFGAFGSNAQLAARIAEAGTAAILDISDCLFTTEGNPRRFRGDEEAGALVTDRLNACRAVLSSIVCLYVIDEPEREADVSADEIRQAAQLARSIAAGFGLLPALHVCYGDGNDYRGAEYIDWLGINAYGEGAGVLERYRRVKDGLRDGQRLCLYVGGSDPWKTSPRPFYDFAQVEPAVVAIIAFLWLDHGDDAGIRDNGMAPEYRAIGAAIVKAQT